jgi:hypothetical protein
MKPSRKVAWITAIIMTILTTLFVVLFVYFRFVVAQNHDHWEFSVDQTGLFLQEDLKVNSHGIDYVSVSVYDDAS